MSGLCGWASGGPRRSDRETILGAMCAALHHRGPDAQRHHFAPQTDVAIGHTWLRAFAPPGSADDAALVADGERCAAVDGPVFARDAVAIGANAAREVLRARRRDGADFPRGLDGPCALAAWDESTKTLCLARDPLGEKPLYYYHDPGRHDPRCGRLVFGSEVKSVLAHPDVPADVDLTGLSLFLTFGWIPAPRTVFAGVRKLAPGERLEWSAERGIELRRHWKLPPLDFDDGDVDAFAKRARELFLQTVEKHVRGLDEVGVFLSGGLDSTILVIALRELGIERIQTFTLGLPSDSRQQRDLDLGYSRQVAERYGTIHHELDLTGSFDPSEIVPFVMARYDDPILTPNTVTKYLLAAAARRAGVSSVLTGSGAGGACGPYRRFRDPHLRRKMLRKVEGFDGDAQRFLRLRGKVLGAADQRSLLPAESVLDREDLARFLAPALGTIRTDEYPRAYVLANLILTCPEKACAVLDRSGMMASVDVRSPHMDRALVEFQMRTPSSFDGGETFVGIKCLLERAFADELPASVLGRPETGFPSYFFNRGELAELQGRLFEREALERTGFLDPDGVRRIVEEEKHDTSKTTGKRAWVLTQLCLWHALHVREDPRWLDVASRDGAAPLLSGVSQPVG